MLHLYRAPILQDAMLDKKEPYHRRLPIVCVVVALVDFIKMKITMNIVLVKVG